MQYQFDSILWRHQDQIIFDASCTERYMEILLPSAEHSQTVIFLHGRDSTVQEFAAEFFESQASDGRTLPEILPNIRWVFPTAGMLHSARFDCELSQWFDMHSTEDPHEREDEQDLWPSVGRIQAILAEEAAIIGAENVFLGGISQGGAVAAHALLNGYMRLGGFIGLCSWCPRPSEIVALDKTTPAVKTPVLLCHAQNDDVIDVRFGSQLRSTLTAIGMDVQWRRYADGGHWINEPCGVDDIVAFLRTSGSTDQQLKELPSKNESSVLRA